MRMGVEVSVDNTFMSPALQSPIALGADIVMHSTTKFLNGHSDGLGGALIGTKPEHKERFLLVQKAAGGILSPFECFLVLRGIKTLPLRMKQHEENGRAVAEFLATQPKLKRLAYPGLKSHPQHELAVKQQRGFGSMLSFDLGTRDSGGAISRRDQAVSECGVAGRGRVAGVALGDHHACGAERRGTREGRDHGGAGAAVGGD